MSIKFTRILKMIEFNRLDISAEVIPTYCALADYSNKKGYCWPKMETLAKTLKCSVRTIQRHIQILKEKGLIEIVKRRRVKGKLSSYLYKIVHIAQLASTGHGRHLEPSRSFPRKSKKSRRSLRNRTKHNSNTPLLPTTQETKEQKRQREDQKRKEGYEWLFTYPSSPETLKKHHEHREKEAQKRYEASKYWFK